MVGRGSRPGRLAVRASTAVRLELEPPLGSARVPAQAAPRADAACVAAALQGERHAEELLYRRHAPAVMAIATRLLGRTAEADDVVQDSFVTAFERLAQLAQPSAFRAWVVRIAVRHVHRRFRRRRLLRGLGLDRGEDDARLADLAQAGLGAEARAELARIDRALNDLPAEQRVAFVLRHVEGYELAEAAVLCGCSLATFKRRLQRADGAVRALVHGGQP